MRMGQVKEPLNNSGIEMEAFVSGRAELGSVHSEGGYVRCLLRYPVPEANEMMHSTTLRWWTAAHEAVPLSCTWD